MTVWLMDKLLLLIFGISFAAAAWICFYYLQVYAFYGLALLLVVGYGIPFITRYRKQE
ncbi:hypothetical protein [Vibrio xiamenensis]|uniref:hypothetical protein n=1 Tax=Vibrio xiamenensis TaxID=861298 RepID=UPI0015A4BC5B|nr:hypothetical protein [Vibrio xiamenensis]